MQDIGLFLVGFCADVVVENGDLKADNGLETAVLISLFTDRFTEVENVPRGEDDQRGWWGDLVSDPADDLIGSTLWTIFDGKILESTLNAVEDAVRLALDWMLEDGIADSIDVTAERVDIEQIDIEIEITKPSGDVVPFKFVWDGQSLKSEGE